MAGMEVDIRPLGASTMSNHTGYGGGGGASGGNGGNYTWINGQGINNSELNGNFSMPFEPQIDPSLYDTLQFQYYAWGIVGSIISVLGVIGNTLSIIVLSNRRMQSSTSYYLIALSVFDIIVLISLVLFMSLPTVYIATGALEWYYRAYPYMHPFAYPTALTAQTCSIYTTVAFTVERYIAVCMPLKAAKMCTASKARKTILILIVVSIVYNIPRMLEFKTVVSVDPMTNETTAIYDYTELGKNSTFRHIYFIYMQLVVMLAIPFVLLAVLNTQLIRAVKRSEQATGKVNTKTKKENSLTIMLISVVVVFMICQVPSIADNILMVTLSQETLYSPPFVKITTISNLMVITNSAINFYVYCVFGKKFRRVFCRIFCKCNLKASKNLLENNTSIVQGSVYNNSQNSKKANTRGAGNRCNGSTDTGSSSSTSRNGFNNNQRSKLAMAVYENGRTRCHYGSREPYPPVHYARIEQQTSV